VESSESEKVGVCVEAAAIKKWNMADVVCPVCGSRTSTSESEYTPVQVPGSEQSYVVSPVAVHLYLTAGRHSPKRTKCRMCYPAAISLR
jgi:NADH pyrophosphatase NudC (nudix superfamily)